MNGGDATEYEDIANMPPGQPPSSQQPTSVATNGGTNYTTNGGCNPADTMSMSPQIKVRTLGFVENGRLLKQEYLEEEDDAAAVGGHSSGNTDHQDQVPNYEAPITVPTNTITTTVPQRVGGLAADEREDLVEFMINQTTRGQQQQPRSQQHQQPPPPPSPSPSTSSSSQVKLEHSPPPESSGIKTEIHDFDTTLPYDGELLSVKKEEHSTTEYMDEQCRPKRYQYFSGESEDDSDEEDEDCDCPDCLIEEVQIIDQNDPVQPPPAPTPPLSASGTDNLEIPAEWYAAERHLRPRTARQQQQQGQRRGQQQGRTTRRQVKRCTWENCEYTNENTHQMYVHIRTRHFGVLATKALQKAANNVEERPPSDFMRNEMIEVPDTPLTDYQADQLQAVFDQTADMTLQEFNSAMENLAFNLKIHERRITDWFKNRRLIQKRMFENGGEIAPNVNRCKRGRPPKKQQQQIRQQLIQQQQQQSGPDEQQAGCSFWNGQNGQQTVTASSTTSENFNEPQPSSFFSPSPSSNPTPPPLTNGNFSSKRNDNSQLPLQNCSRSLPLPNPSIITLSQHKQQLQQQQQQSATVSMAKMSLQNDQSNVGDGSNQQSSTTAVNQATAVSSVLNLSTRGPPAFVAVIDGQVRQLYSLPRGFTGTVPLTQVSNLQLAEAAVSNSIAAATTNSGSPIPVNNNNTNSSRNENPSQISVPRSSSVPIPSSVPPSSPRNTTNSPSVSQGINSSANSTATPPPPRSRIPCKHVLEAAAAVRAAKPPPPAIKDEQEDSDDDIQILPTPWTPSTSRSLTSTPQRGTGATNTTTPYHKIPCRRASAQLNKSNNTFSASTTPRASTFDQSNDTTTTTATQLGIRRVVSETEVEQKSGPTMCQARLAQLMADIKVETAKQLQTSVPEKQVACLIKKGPERPPPNSCLFYNSSSRFTAFSRSRPPPPPIPKEKQQDYSSKVLEALQKSGCLTPAVESSASTGESSVSAVESSASTSAASTSPPTVNKEQKKQQQQPQSKPAANQNRLNERLNETSTESTAAAAEASTPTECNSRALNLSAFSSATVVPSASTDSLSAVDSSSSTVAPSAFASSTPAVNKQKKKQPKQPKPAANQTRSNERLNALSSSTESATSPPPPPRVARVHPLPPPSRSTSSSSTPRSTSSGNRNNNYRIGSNVRRPTEVANDVSIALENALVHSGVSLAEAIASSSDASNPFSETSNASLGTVSAVTTSTTVTSSSRPEPRAGTASGTSNSLRTPTSTSTTQNRPSEHRPHHSKVARTSSETSNSLRSPRKSTAFTFSSSRPTEQPKVTVSGTSTLISVASAATSSRPPPEHRHQQSKISATSETTKNPSLSRTSSASSLGSSSLSNTSAKAPLKPSSASSAKSPRTEVSQPPKSQQNKQPQRPSSISSLNAVQRPTSRSSLDSSTSSARGGNVPPLRSPPPSSSTKSGNKRYRPLSPSEDSATPPVKRQTSRPEFENSSSRSTLNNEKPRSASGRDHPKVQQQQKYPQNREPQQQHYPQAPRTPRRELCSPTRPVASGVPSSVALSAPTTVTTPTTPTAPTESVRARLSSFLDPRSQAMPLSSAGAVPVANRVPSRPLPRQTSLTEVGSTLSRLAASSTASAAATLSRQNSLGNEVGGSSGSKTPRRLSNDGDADDGVGGGPLNRYVSSGNGGGNSSDRNSEPLPKIQKLQNQNSFYADFFQPEEQNDANKNAPSSSSSSLRPPPLNDSRKESSSSSSRPPPPNDSRDSSRFSNSNSADPRSPSPSSSSSNSNLNNNNNNTNKNRDSGSASASSSTYSSKYSTYSNSASKSSSSSNLQATASAASTESSSSSSSTPAKPILNEYSRKYRIYRTGNGTTKIQLKPEEPYSSNRNVSPPPTPSSTNSDSSRPPSSPPTSLISEPTPEPRLLDSAVPRIPIRRVLDDPSLAPVDPRLARTSAFSANLVSATSDSVYSRIATSSASVAPSILFNTTVRPPPPPPGASIPVRTDPRLSNYSFPTFPNAAAPPSPVPTTPSRSLISVRTDARLFHSFAGAATAPSSSTPSSIPVLTDARMSNYSFPGSTAVPSAPKTPLLPAPSVARSTSFNSTVGSPAPGSSNLVRIESRMSNYSIVPGSAVPSPGPTASPVSTDNPAELFPNDVDYRLRPHPPTENSRADSHTSNFSYPRSSGHSNNRNNNIILGHVTVQMDAKSSQILEDRTTQLPLEVVPTAEEMLKELQSLPLVDDDEEDEEEELLSLPEILDNHLMRMKSGGSNGSLLDGTTTTTGKSVDDLFGMVMKSADGKEVKEDLSKKGDDGQPKNVEDLFGIVLTSAEDGRKDAEELMMLQGDDHPDAKELNDQEEEELLKDDAEKELNDEEEEELLKGDEEDDEFEKEEEESEESEEEDSDSDYEVVDSYIVPPVLTLQHVVKTEELEVEMDSQNNNKSLESDNSGHSLDEPEQLQEQQESDNSKGPITADDGLDEEMVVVKDSVEIKEEDIKEEEMEEEDVDEDDDDDDDDCFEVVDSCIIPANVLVEESVETRKEPETQKVSTEVQVGQLDLVLSEPMDLELMEQPEEQQEKVGNQKSECSSNDVPTIEKPETKLTTVVLTSVEPALAVSDSVDQLLEDSIDRRKDDSVGTETLEESSNGHHAPLTDAAEMLESIPVVTMEANVAYCPEVINEEQDESNLKVVEEDSEKVESTFEVTKVEPPKTVVPTELGESTSVIEPLAHEEPELEPPNTTVTITDSTESSLNIQPEETVAGSQLSAITIDDSNSLVALDCGLGDSAKLSSPAKSSPSSSQRLVHQNSTEFEPNMAILEPELTDIPVISEPVAMNPTESVLTVVITETEPSTSGSTTISSNIPELESLSQAQSTESSNIVDSCPKESQLCDAPPIVPPSLPAAVEHNSEPVEMPSSSSSNSVLVVKEVVVTESPTKPTTRSQAAVERAESSSLSKSQDEDADDEDDDEEGDSNASRTLSKRPKRSKAQQCTERNQSLLKSSAKSCKATISEASSSTSTPSKAKKCLVKSISSDNFYSTRRSVAAAAKTNAESEDGGGGALRKRSLRDRSLHKVDSPVKKAKLTNTPCGVGGTPSRPALRSSTVSSSTSVVESAAAPPSSSSSPAQPTRQSVRISSSRAQAEEEAAIAAAPPGARDRREYFRDYMRKYRDTKNTAENSNANQTANKNPVPNSSSSAAKRKGSK